MDRRSFISAVVGAVTSLFVKKPVAGRVMCQAGVDGFLRPTVAYWTAATNTMVANTTVSHWTYGNGKWRHAKGGNA